MLTTFLNPTVWLLAALAAVSAVGIRRRWTARRSFEIFLHAATRLPVLIAVGALALGGAASRLVLGYAAPGAYAEEVLAARTFLSERRVYGADDRAEFTRWIASDPGFGAQWLLSGVSACQAGAAAERPHFYSAQAHSPVLLLGAVPVVAAAGERGLYVVLSLASLLAVAAIAVALGARAGIPRRSRAGVLLVAALLGWQPVLAALRQGDAVLLTAGLVAVSWLAATRAHPRAGGAALGLAAAAYPPLMLGLPACLRRAPGVSVAAAVASAAVVLGTLAAAGPMVARDFAVGAHATAVLYAAAPSNYAMSGRVLASGVAIPVGLLVFAAFTAAAAGWLGRDLDRVLGAAALTAILASPVAWSQHLALSIVAVAVTLGAALCRERPHQLGGWALLTLAISLPDAGVVAVHQALAAAAGRTSPVALPSLALLAFALWLMIPSSRVSIARVVTGSTPPGRAARMVGAPDPLRYSVCGSPRCDVPGTTVAPCGLRHQVQIPA